MAKAKTESVRNARPPLAAPFEFNRFMLSVQDLLTESVVSGSRKTTKAETVTRDEQLKRFLIDVQAKAAKENEAINNAVGANRQELYKNSEFITYLTEDMEKLSVAGIKFFEKEQEKKQKLADAQRRTLANRIKEYSLDAKEAAKIYSFALYPTFSGDKKLAIEIHVNGLIVHVSSFSHVPYEGTPSTESRKPLYSAKEHNGVKCHFEFDNLDEFIAFVRCDKDEYKTFRSTRYAGIVRFFAYIIKTMVESKDAKKELGDLVTFIDQKAAK